MRRLPREAVAPLLSRHRSVAALDAASVVARLGLLLIVALGFAFTAQFLLGATP